jgi:hypothetical protein
MSVRSPMEIEELARSLLKDQTQRYELNCGSIVRLERYGTNYSMCYGISFNEGACIDEGCPPRPIIHWALLVWLDTWLSGIRALFRQPIPRGVLACSNGQATVTVLLLLHMWELVTYFVGQSPSWEANRFSDSHEIPRCLWNPKVHCRIYKFPSPVRTLTRINPLRATHPTSWRSILILSSHLDMGPASGLFPSPCVRQGTENHKQGGNVWLLIIFCVFILCSILWYNPELLEGWGIMEEYVEGSSCGQSWCTSWAGMEGLRKWRIITDQVVGCLEWDLNLGSYERKKITNYNRSMAELCTTFWAKWNWLIDTAVDSDLLLIDSWNYSVH